MINQLTDSCLNAFGASFRHGRILTKDPIMGATGRGVVKVHRVALRMVALPQAPPKGGAFPACLGGAMLQAGGLFAITEASRPTLAGSTNRTASGQHY